jgi:hypothetical protein
MTMQGPTTSFDQVLESRVYRCNRRRHLRGVEVLADGLEDDDDGVARWKVCRPWNEGPGSSDSEVSRSVHTLVWAGTHLRPNPTPSHRRIRRVHPTNGTYAMTDGEPERAARVFTHGESSQG